MDAPITVNKDLQDDFELKMKNVKGLRYFSAESVFGWDRNFASSENLDFYVSTRTGYNIVNRSLRKTTENYFNQSTRARLTWVAWKGLVYRTDLSHQLNTGLSTGFNTNYLIWNMSIGKKVFANQRGEISLSVFDLLKQNVSIRRNVTDILVEDVQSNVLQRYFMLTFTYNLRHFSGGAKSEADFQQPGGEDRSRGRGRN
jgi:hypothetical protein